MSVDFTTRVMLVALACYAVAGAAGALVVRRYWRRLLEPVGSLAPQSVATRLSAMRLAPAAFGTLIAALAVMSFLLFEANPHREEIGPTLPLLAAGVLVLAAAATRRGLLAWRASIRLERRWRTADPWSLGTCRVPVMRADTPFPVVALLGVVRPRLIVSSRVIEACTAGELDAIVRHELAHQSAMDNLRRMLFVLCPDVLAGSATARAMEHAWSEAAEQAADDRAAGGSDRRRLDLASALVKVARLAAGLPVPPLPASALFRGEPVADRIRRLIDPPPAASTRRTSPAAWIALIVTGVTLPAALPALHDVVEAALTFGR